MKSLKSFRLLSLMAMAVVFLGTACSQSRRGFVEPAEIEIWSPQELCRNEGGLQVKGCFEVTLHYTDNYAEFYVVDIGIAPQDATNFPYRVLGRVENSSTWHLLRSGITMTKGGSFRIDPRGDRDAWIEDYEEFIIELESRISADGLSYEPAPAGQGERLVRDVIDYPELYQKK